MIQSRFASSCLNIFLYLSIIFSSNLTLGEEVHEAVCSSEVTDMSVNVNGSTNKLKAIKLKFSEGNKLSLSSGELSVNHNLCHMDHDLEFTGSTYWLCQLDTVTFFEGSIDFLDKKLSCKVLDRITKSVDEQKQWCFECIDRYNRPTREARIGEHPDCPVVCSPENRSEYRRNKQRSLENQ